METRDTAVHPLKGYALSIIKANRNNQLAEEDKELKRFLSGIRAYVGYP